MRRCWFSAPVISLNGFSPSPLSPLSPPNESPKHFQKKQSRDNDKVKRTLADLAACARGDGNTMTAILDCVRVYATEGEIVDTLRPIFGEYQEPPMF